MKSVVIKGKREFEVKEIDFIQAENGEVVIEITKSGICGSDIHYYEAGGPLGLIMGHEFSGIVVDPGEREDLNVGDRVTALPISPCLECDACKKGNIHFCDNTWNEAIGISVENPGGLTEKIAVRGDMVVKVPSSISDEEVAMVEPTAVGLHAIHLADIKVGDKVLVVGGGIIGLTSAMFAKMEGASFVAVTDTNVNRAIKSVKLGVADEYYDATDEKVLEEMMMETRGGFDIVIDCSGNSKAVTTCIQTVKAGGLIVLVGVSIDPVTIPLIAAVMKEVTLKGAIAYTKDEFETCIELMDLGRIDMAKFVDDVVSLDEVPEAYERLTSGKDDAIKILVDPKKDK